MFFVKGGLRASFISSRVGLLVQMGAHTLCCLNGGPNFLRRPFKTMIEAQIYIIMSAYTTPEWRPSDSKGAPFSLLF